MRVGRACAVEALEFRKKIFLCRIYVAPRSIVYSSGHEPLLTHRWMQAEHWARFDSQIQNILHKWSGAQDVQSLEGEELFYVTPLIRVSVRKSRVQKTTICRILDIGEQQRDNVALVLECSIVYSEGDLLTKRRQDADAETVNSSTSVTVKKKKTHEEYEPEGLNGASYVSYTPSTNMGGGVVENEPYEVMNSSQETEYIPSRIKMAPSTDLNADKLVDRTRKKLKGEQNNNEDLIEKTRRQGEKQRNEENSTSTMLKKYTKYSSNESDDDTTPPNNKQRLKHENLCIPLRRSARSPVKKTWLLQAENATRTKRQKSQQSLFGSDDEFAGDNCRHIDANSPSVPTSKPMSSKKGKRKHANCQQEKNSIGMWLGSRNSSNMIATSGDNTAMSSVTANKMKEKQSPMDYQNLELLKAPKEVLLEQQKMNQKVKAILESSMEPDPVEVAYLSLENLKEAQIIETFGKHKAKLDEIFSKLQHRTKVNSYNGVDHYTVLKLLPDDVQQAMLRKLEAMYEGEDGAEKNKYSHVSTLRAHLYLNAMLPEWIIMIFMMQHNFTRGEAVNHIKAQNSYKLRMESMELDNSLGF